MQDLTANEQALESLMNAAANKPRTRGACAWATINGHEIRCDPIYGANGLLKTYRFVMDGQLVKREQVFAAIR